MDKRYEQLQAKEREQIAVGVAKCRVAPGGSKRTAKGTACGVTSFAPCAGACPRNRRRAV